jgi:hypothetical protein
LAFSSEEDRYAGRPSQYKRKGNWIANQSKTVNFVQLAVPIFSFDYKFIHFLFLWVGLPNPLTQRIKENESELIRQ